MLICGIDEAGRGPCIGPMIIVGVMLPEDKLDNLKNMGVKDSKLLAHRRRCLLASEIEKIAKYKIIKIYPAEIDYIIDSTDHMNLNWLEAHKTAEIINDLKPNKAIIDSPSPNLNSYKSYLKKLLKHNTEIICEHKADFNYPIVAAASIIAKCVREEEVKKIEKEIGESIGSGYPADPKTAEFLKKNHNKYSKIFRKSWSSYKNIKAQKDQKTLDKF